MTPSHSPPPWTVDEAGNIIDANGERVIADDGAIYPEDRRLIVTAVNNHARLSRDLAAARPEKEAMMTCLNELYEDLSRFPVDDGRGVRGMLERIRKASSDDGWVNVNEAKQFRVLLDRFFHGCPINADGRLEASELALKAYHELSDLTYRRRPSAEQGG